MKDVPLRQIPCWRDHLAPRKKPVRSFCHVFSQLCSLCHRGKREERRRKGTNDWGRRLGFHSCSAPAILFSLYVTILDCSPISHISILRKNNCQTNSSATGSQRAINHNAKGKGRMNALTTPRKTMTTVVRIGEQSKAEPAERTNPIWRACNF